MGRIKIDSCYVFGGSKVDSKEMSVMTGPGSVREVNKCASGRNVLKGTGFMNDVGPFEGQRRGLGRRLVAGGSEARKKSDGADRGDSFWIHGLVWRSEERRVGKECSCR